MKLTCLRCASKGTVVLLLDETPRFSCSKCNQTYGEAEARAELTELFEGWEKVLTWTKTMPKPGAGQVAAVAPPISTKSSTPTSVPPAAPTKSSAPAPAKTSGTTKSPSPSKLSLPKPPPPKQGGSMRSG